MSDSSLRVLLLEETAFLLDPLRDRGCRVEIATGALDARLAAGRRDFAAVVVDAESALPDGERLLPVLAREHPALPLVAVGPIEAGAILAAFRAGAREYLDRSGSNASAAAERVARLLRAPADLIHADGNGHDGCRARLVDGRRETSARDGASRELEGILEAELERMLLLFEHTAEAAVFADRSGEIFLANRAAGAFFGTSALGAVGRSLDLVAADADLRAAIAASRRGALAGEETERVVVGADGRRTLVRTIPTPDARRGIGGTLTLLRDETARAAREGHPPRETVGSLP